MTHIIKDTDECVTIYVQPDEGNVDFSWVRGEDEFYKRFTRDEAVSLLKALDEAVEKIDNERGSE